MAKKIKATGASQSAVELREVLAERDKLRHVLGSIYYNTLRYSKYAKETDNSFLKILREGDPNPDIEYSSYVSVCKWCEDVLPAEDIAEAKKQAAEGRLADQKEKR